MLTRLISELIGIFIRLKLQAPQLVKVSLVWFSITALGVAMTGVPSLLERPTVMTPLALAGSVIYLFGVLAGWYSTHRFLVNPQQAAEYIPSNRQLRFMITQVVIILFMSMAAAILILPLAMNHMPAYDNYMTFEQAQAQARAASTPYMPVVMLFMVLLFSRLLLVAPLIVRDEKQALRRSWRATRGQTIRLFLLQLGCIIPAALGGLLAGLLSFVFPLAVVLSTAGLFVSLLAYTQLAETEYAALLQN